MRKSIETREIGTRFGETCAAGRGEGGGGGRGEKEKKQITATLSISDPQTRHSMCDMNGCLYQTGA